MPPFFAFSNSCSCASWEFLSARGDGLSAGRIGPRNPRPRGAALVAAAEFLVETSDGGICAKEKFDAAIAVRAMSESRTERQYPIRENGILGNACYARWFPN